MDLKAIFQILHCDLVKPKLNLFMSIKAYSTFSGNLAPPCVKDRSGGTRRKPIRVCNVAKIKQKHAKDGILPFFCFGRVKPLSSYFVISSSARAVAPSDPSALQASSLEAMQATSFSATCQAEIIQIIQRKPETSLRSDFHYPRDSQKLETLSWRGSRVLSLQNRANSICGWTTGFCVGKKVHSQRWTCPDAKPCKTHQMHIIVSYLISSLISYLISDHVMKLSNSSHIISFGYMLKSRARIQRWNTIRDNKSWNCKCPVQAVWRNLEDAGAKFGMIEGVYSTSNLQCWAMNRDISESIPTHSCRNIVPELDETKIETRNLFF